MGSNPTSSLNNPLSLIYLLLVLNQRYCDSFHFSLCLEFVISRVSTSVTTFKSISNIHSPVLYWLTPEHVAQNFVFYVFLFFTSFFGFFPSFCLIFHPQISHPNYTNSLFDQVHILWICQNNLKQNSLTIQQFWKKNSPKKNSTIFFFQKNFKKVLCD